MNTFWRPWQLFAPYRGWIWLGVLLASLTILANVALLALSGWFITAMGLAGILGTQINYFTPAAGIRGLAMARTGGRYAERIVTHEATFRLIAELRLWFYEKIEPLAPAGLEGLHSGDIFSRIKADIDKLDNFYLRILLPLLVAIWVAGLSTLFLAWYSIWLAAVNLLLMLLSALVIPLWINHLAWEPGKKLAKNAAQLRENSLDAIQGLAELSIFDGNAQKKATILHISQQRLVLQTQMRNLDALTQAGLGLAAHLAIAAALVILTPLFVAGQVSGPVLVMLALFTLASFEAIAPVPLAFQVLAETLEAAKRLFELTDQVPAEFAGEAVPGKIQSIEIQQIDFAYPNQPKVFENFALSINQGDKIALIGPSGNGKSTLIDLILGFRRPQAGRIMVNGRDLNQLDLAQWRKNIAVASQHDHLFNATIAENLRLGAPQVSQGRLEQICQTVVLHDFIQALPENYDTWIGEAGAKLSGGQLKRLSIARALLKPAEVVILDEPTEGLDPITAKKMMQALQTEIVDKTVLVISHQLIGCETFKRISL